MEIKQIIEGSAKAIELYQEALKKETKRLIENNKYYTPSIEDIRVGYECEIKPLNSEYDWLPAKLKHEKGYNGEGLYNINPFWYSVIDKDGFPVKAIINDLSQVRTPYLTKEQIEAEGWEIVQENYCVKNQYRLSLLPNNMIHISVTNVSTVNMKTLFIGNCPSINEFRTICKLLNIK